jgi:hypothetical protein
MLRLTPQQYICTHRPPCPRYTSRVLVILAIHVQSYLPFSSSSLHTGSSSYGHSCGSGGQGHGGVDPQVLGSQDGASEYLQRRQREYCGGDGLADARAYGCIA